MFETKQKRIRATQVFLAVVLFIVMVVFYFYSSVDVEQNNNKTKTNNYQAVDVTNKKLFEEQLNQDLVDKDKQISDLSKEVDGLKELVNIMVASNTPTEEASEIQDFPSTPTEQTNYSDESRGGEPEEIQSTWVGDIIHEEYTFNSQEPNETELEVKKKTVKLPPSFMPGFLLTGMDAMTMQGSSNNPEPMMIRVQGRAILPNEFWANLGGCFVIAEGYGNLATHRVDARLVSLSCVDIEGNSVIYEKIEGYLQDKDGKRGLAGVVVHKAGASIARMMLAGVFQGAGDALVAASTPKSITDEIGQQITGDSGSGKKIALAALGGGISKGADGLTKLFLDLARQSSPIIEVGAAKEISVVITKLVELKIKGL